MGKIHHERTINSTLIKHRISYRFLFNRLKVAGHDCYLIARFCIVNPVEKG